MAANDRQVGGDHYRDQDIQPWEAMEAWMSDEEFKGFLKGNALKYIARSNHKGTEQEDLAKAHHYLSKLVELSGESGDQGLNATQET